MTVVAINSFVRGLLEDRLPEWVEPRWFLTGEEMCAAAPDAEIAWFDAFDLEAKYRATELATRVRWINTLAAGVERFPLDLLRERGVILTNGAGLNAIPIAEYIVMGMLVIAKGYRAIVRSQDEHRWLDNAPATGELDGSRALIVGAGGIGAHTAGLLRPWGVDVVEVRRRPASGCLSADEWRARLGEFDWVVIAVPSTPETTAMFGTEEFAAMKRGAAILNVSRGEVIDQDALIAAVRSGHLGGAFLDVTDPEPLPPDHPLWGFDNIHITSHLSGRTQTRLFARAADRFVENLGRWHRGDPLESQVDLSRGY